MSDKSDNSGMSKFARFSTVGIQMGIIIAGFTYLGVYLDERSKNETPGWTIGLALFGVFAGLYIMIREVIKMGKKDD